MAYNMLHTKWSYQFVAMIVKFSYTAIEEQSKRKKVRQIDRTTERKRVSEREIV